MLKKVWQSVEFTQQPLWVQALSFRSQILFGWLPLPATDPSSTCLESQNQPCFAAAGPRCERFGTKPEMQRKRPTFGWWRHFTVLGGRCFHVTDVPCAVESAGLLLCCVRWEQVWASRAYCVVAIFCLTIRKSIILMCQSRVHASLYRIAASIINSDYYSWDGLKEL